MVMGRPSVIEVAGLRLAKRTTRAISWWVESPTGQISLKIVARSDSAASGRVCNSSARQPSIPTAL